MANKDLPNLPEEFNSFVQATVEFRLELSKETDRGVVILSTSYVEYQLEQLLTKILIGSSKQKESLLNGFGPLSTFSAKIKLLYSFGIMPRAIYQELELIRSIRNEFAHNALIISFTTESIQSKCNNLTLVVPYKDMSSRQKFLNSISGIYGLIDQLIRETKKISEPTDVDVEARRNEYTKILKDFFAKA